MNIQRDEDQRSLASVEVHYHVEMGILVRLQSGGMLNGKACIGCPLELATDSLRPSHP
jgi:hypothetical protein